MQWPAARGSPARWRRQGAERGRAVEVVRVDRRERFRDLAPSGADGVRRAPRLRPVRRHRETRRHVGQILERVGAGDPRLPFRSDRFPERRLDVPPDHEDDAAEAGTHGVEDGIIQHDLARGPTGSICFRPP
jgi:hypothetical protein